ncbi:hypothetical protein A3K71_02980 [archaeon RBG_16_50_20]|nr:MAG: hypothetical protein A3K71_02980 [archaeon RBG_16_50_20]
MTQTRKRIDWLPAPDYFSAKGMMRDHDWLESYFSVVLQWPKTCTVSLKDRQLVGLAKSLAFNWEPGILNHTDLALKTGSTPEEVTEVIKATSATLGLAELDMTAQTKGTLKLSELPRLNSLVRKSLKAIESYYRTVPSCFRHKIVTEDPQWFLDFVSVTKPAYDLGTKVLDPKLRSLVCLAAAAVMNWQNGVRLYSASARRFGATERETFDVIRSVFKTAVSNAMAAGFRIPCHIPNLRGYRTILRAYVDKGALAGKRRRDPLTR